MSRKTLHTHTEHSMGRSWSGSLAVLDEMTVEEALALFPGDPGCTSPALGAEEAFRTWVHDACEDESGERLADVILGQFPLWLILLDPAGVTLRWHGQGRWQRLSADRRVFVLAIQRTADFYGFWYYRDGAVRRAIQRAGVSLSDDGSPAWSPCRFEVGVPLAEEDGLLEKPLRRMRFSGCLSGSPAGTGNTSAVWLPGGAV